jgi:hypothetical protein
VSEEATTKDLWEKLGKLYQSKSLVNKLFLRKKLYNLRMRDGDSVAEHLNAFNTVVSQLVSVEIKILDEDKCISLLCSLPDSWDSLVVAIGSNTTSLKFEEVVSSLLSEEMRQRIWKDIAQTHYLQEDVPRKEIDLISQVGDLSLRVDLNLSESL